jgi:hypothetical protein
VLKANVARLEAEVSELRTMMKDLCAELGVVMAAHFPECAELGG